MNETESTVNFDAPFSSIRIRRQILKKQRVKMSSMEIVKFVINEVLFKIVQEKNEFLQDDVISERSDSMYSYPESNKDDQVIPGYFNKDQSNQGRFKA